MSIAFYQVLHLVGIVLTFMSIGYMVAVARQSTDAKTARRFAAMFHGLGLLMVLVAGFGMLAKLDMGFPLFILGKIVIWFLLGGIGAVIMRAPRLAFLCWWVAVALGGAAGYLIWVRPT